MPWVAFDPTQAGSEVSLWRHGSHQDARRSIVRRQILLCDEAAHGVADHHRSAWQVVCNEGHILDIVGDRTCAQRLGTRAAAVAPKADGHGAITLIGEEAKEMFVPAPCCMPR